MKHSDLLKLRWLRMEAIHNLQSDEYDLVVSFTTRYQNGESPSFSEEEIEALGKVYTRVRSVSGYVGSNDPVSQSV